jgi:hypothetical protein
MTDLCIPININVQVNIVPFGTIQIIDSYYPDYQPPEGDDEDNVAFEFPTGSVISGSIIYEQLTLSPKSP